MRTQTYRHTQTHTHKYTRRYTHRHKNNSYPGARECHPPGWRGDGKDQWPRPATVSHREATGFTQRPPFTPDHGQKALRGGRSPFRQNQHRTHPTAMFRPFLPADPRTPAQFPPWKQASTTRAEGHSKVTHGDARYRPGSERPSLPDPSPHCPGAGALNRPALPRWAGRLDSWEPAPEGQGLCPADQADPRPGAEGLWGGGRASGKGEGKGGAKRGPEFTG